MEHFSRFGLLGKDEWKRRQTHADSSAAITDAVASCTRRHMIATADLHVPGRGKELFEMAARQALQGELDAGNHEMMVMCTDLVTVYLTTKNRMVRDHILAHLCGRLSLKQIQAIIVHLKSESGGSVKPVKIYHGVSKRAFKRGRALHAKLLNGEQLAAQVHASRTSDDDGIAMLDFIRIHCPLGVKAGVVRKARVGGVSCDFCPLVRSMNASDFWKKYVAWRSSLAPSPLAFVDPAILATEQTPDDARATTAPPSVASVMLDCTAPSLGSEASTKTRKAWTPGRGTFRAFLKCVTIEAKKKECLSYYYVGLLDARGMYDKLLARNEEIHDAAVELLRRRMRDGIVTKLGKTSLSNVESALAPLLEKATSRLPSKKIVQDKRAEAKQVLKCSTSHLSSHLAATGHDPVGVHCCLNAVGGCDQEHPDHCLECEKAHKFGDSTWSFFNSNTNALLRALEKTLPEFAGGRKLISVDLPEQSNVVQKQATITTMFVSPPPVPEAVSVEVDDSHPDADTAEDTTDDLAWVACHRCEKWRILPFDVDGELLPSRWVCKDAALWRPGMSCATPEDKASRPPSYAFPPRVQASPIVLPIAGDTPMPVENEITLDPNIPVKVTEAIASVMAAQMTATEAPNSEQMEGHLRRELIEIVSLVHNMQGCTGHWASHDARGCWQEEAMRMMHANLQENPNRMIATIDMKSKTTAAKHRTDQGFGFGLRGMSIQGAMLERWRKPTDGGARFFLCHRYPCGELRMSNEKTASFLHVSWATVLASAGDMQDHAKSYSTEGARRLRFPP
jgi:hypothetical protein